MIFNLMKKYIRSSIRYKLLFSTTLIPIIMGFLFLGYTLLFSIFDMSRIALVQLSEKMTSFYTSEDLYKKHLLEKTMKIAKIIEHNLELNISIEKESFPFFENILLEDDLSYIKLYDKQYQLFYTTEKEQYQPELAEIEIEMEVFFKKKSDSIIAVAVAPVYLPTGEKGYIKIAQHFNIFSFYSEAIICDENTIYESSVGQRPIHEIFQNKNISFQTSHTNYFPKNVGFYYYIVSGFPILNSSDLYLVIGRDYSWEQAIFKEYGYALFVLALLTIIIVIFIARKLGSNISLPIMQLTKISNKIASGKYVNLDKQEQFLDRKDELGDLYHNFKNMIDQLSKVQEDLRRSNLQTQKNMQLIVSQEKLASLGTMVSGIAHEINNPTQAIKFSMDSFKLNLKDLKPIIWLILQLTNHDKEQNNKIITELITTTKETDLKTILEELKYTSEGILSSTERIEHIIRGTKRLSYVSNDFKIDNINRIIEDSFRLYQNQLKPLIHTNLELDSSLPQIKCLPQEISQMIINLLSNAKDAVLDIHNNFKEEKLITIKTQYINKNDYISIFVKDNGIGIPNQNINYIYDPFFTTKEIGKGTGIGLHIVYRIVTLHNGIILVNSTKNQGSEFEIKLPVVTNKLTNQYS